MYIYKYLHLVCVSMSIFLSTPISIFIIIHYVHIYIYIHIHICTYRQLPRGDMLAVPTERHGPRRRPDGSGPQLPCKRLALLRLLAMRGARGCCGRPRLPRLPAGGCSRLRGQKELPGLNSAGLWIWIDQLMSRALNSLDSHP